MDKTALPKIELWAQGSQLWMGINAEPYQNVSTYMYDQFSIKLCRDKNYKLYNF